MMPKCTAEDKESCTWCSDPVTQQGQLVFQLWLRSSSMGYGAAMVGLWLAYLVALLRLLPNPTRDLLVAML